MGLEIADSVRASLESESEFEFEFELESATATGCLLYL